MAKGKQLDAFEIAKEIETTEYERKKKILLEAKKSLENNAMCPYDSGLSEIEDRNELNFIKGQIDDLDDEHIKKINSLHIPQKDSR